MKKIAIIPARSGSKGLKDKNILLLNGKHMIGWTIEAAKQSNMFERVIVSTESEKYMKICESYGAEIMKRKPELATDNATTFDVLQNVLNNIKEEYDYFVLLQPTSPLRDSIDIIEACKLFEKNISMFDFLVSVSRASHSSDLIKPIIDGSMEAFDKDFSKYRRQDKEEFYPNGAIFISKIDSYISQKHFFGRKSIAFKMDKLNSIDIDDILDFKMAEVAMKEFVK